MPEFINSPDKKDFQTPDILEHKTKPLSDFPVNPELGNMLNEAKKLGSTDGNESTLEIIDVPEAAPETPAIDAAANEEKVKDHIIEELRHDEYDAAMEDIMDFSNVN